MTAAWQHFGFSPVIFLAALRAIPAEVIEAADARRRAAASHASARHAAVARAGATINVLLSTIGGLKLFDQVFAITGGGPGHATETLSTRIFDEAFARGRYGYSTAIALVLTLLVAAVVLAQLQVLRRGSRREALRAAGRCCSSWRCSPPRRRSPTRSTRWW